MPRAGVLMMRSRLMVSCGLSRTLQIRDDVLDFGALVETEAADHDVLASVAPQGFFNLSRLGVGAIQHRDVLLRIARHVRFDLVGDPQGFVFGVGSFVQRDLVALARLGPEPFADALGVVGDHGAGGFQDVLGRAVVLLQADGDRARKIALEVEDVADIRPAPAVDGLVLVADHGDVVAIAGQQAHQIVLAAIGVLIFVHHQEFVASIDALLRGRVVRQQAHGFEQQIVEIERIRFAQPGLVALIDHGQARRGGIGGGASHLRGRLLDALGVADARKRRAMLHELVVQAELLVDGSQDRDLIVVVVDGELRGEAGANLRQRRAFAPEQADAEGVERGDGRGVARLAGNQGTDALAHFTGGLVGEGDGQDGPSGNLVGADQVGDAVRDHAGLAAARAGQDQ